jgi:hypothetical protein
MNNDNGGSAFPVQGMDMQDCGMTLRDYFAAKAMQGFAGGGGYDKWEYLTQDAYAVADAMLKARGVGNE